MTAHESGGRGEPSLPRPLLDRFLRDGDGRHPPARMDAAEYAAAVRRDMETLLNTRAGVGAESDADSVTGYGLPDFAHLSPDSTEDLWRMAAAVKDALHNFETRIENIRVGADGGVLLVTADLKTSEEKLAFRLDTR